MARLDDVVGELGDIALRLDQLPVDSPERKALEERRADLKAEANALSGDATRRALERELRQLEDRLEALDRLRLDVVGFSGGGSMGGDFGFAADAMRLNQAMDEANNRAGLETRIRILRQNIAAMEGR